MIRSSIRPCSYYFYSQVGNTFTSTVNSSLTWFHKLHKILSLSKNVGLWSPHIPQSVCLFHYVTKWAALIGPATTAVIYPQVVGFQIIILHIKISVGGSTFFRAEAVKRGPGRGHLSAPLRALYQLAPRGPGASPPPHTPRPVLLYPRSQRICSCLK